MSMTIAFGPFEQLAIVATACGLLVVAFVVIVCMVSPYCWCHRHCPFAPRYPGEGVRRDREGSGRQKGSLIRGRSGYIELDFQPGEKSPDYQIIPSVGQTDQSETDGSEASPLSKEVVNRKYDSVSARLPDDVSSHPAAGDARSRGHFRYSRKPVKSLEIYIRWNDVDGTAGVVLRTLHLTRVKRRKGIVVKMELLTDKNTIWSRLKDVEEEVVATYQSEIREQVACVNFEETFTLDWVRTRGKGTLRFAVHAVEGTTVTDAIGKAELPLQELDTTQPLSIRLYLTSPQQIPKGECQVSVCYLPTAEKLCVIVTECRNLRTNVPSGDEMDFYLQMSLLYKNRTIGKRKSSFRQLKGPVLHNVPMDVSHTFDLPSQRLNVVCLMLTFKRHTGDTDSDSRTSDSRTSGTDIMPEVFSEDEAENLPHRDVAIGSVVIGLESGVPEGQAHWSEMIATPRMPIVYWHRIT